MKPIVQTYIPTNRTYRAYSFLGVENWDLLQLYWNGLNEKEEGNTLLEAASLLATASKKYTLIPLWNI